MINNKNIVNKYFAYFYKKKKKKNLQNNRISDKSYVFHVYLLTFAQYTFIRLFLGQSFDIYNLIKRHRSVIHIPYA